MLKKLALRAAYRNMFSKGLNKEIKAGTLDYKIADSLIKSLQKEKKLKRIQIREIHKYILGRRAAFQKATDLQYVNMGKAYKGTIEDAKIVALRHHKKRVGHKPKFPRQYSKEETLKRAIKKRINLRTVKKREVFN